MELHSRQGRLARKIVMIFVLFALIPTALLSVVAVNHLAKEAKRQAIASLDYQVEVFSHEIFNHLRATDSRLGSTNPEDQLDIRRHTADAPGNTLPELSTIQRHRLFSGRSVLVSDSREAIGENRVYLLRAAEPGNDESAILSVVLHEALIFGDPETWDLSSDFCIFDDSRQLLYATNSLVCERSLATPESRGSMHRGHHEYLADNRGYVSSYRSLFLKKNYGIESWFVAVSKPSDELFSAYNIFQARFIGLAIAVVLALTLASLWMIRRQMSPLPDIMSGIKRVTQRDYSQPVAVDSNDELGELASAFNFMSAQVSRQLRTQASLSEIDQLILSRVRKEDIVDIVLEKTAEILPHDHICMLLVGDEGAVRAYSSSLDMVGSASTDRSLAVDIRDLDKEQVAMGSTWDREGDDKIPLPWLQDLVKPRYRYLTLLPIEAEGTLIAILCLGFINRPETDEENDKLALAYSNRIAVALANAEWEDRLYQQAHYDALTGLPNRPAMLDMLRQTIDHARREARSFAVLFVDLDDFKLVNDSMGHSVGDELIRKLAARFRAELRSSDTVFRLGGDEFVVISRSCSHPEMAADVARRIAERMLRAINRSIEISGYEIRSAGSIGISVYDKDGKDSEALLKNADIAMYHSKSLQKGQYQFYAEELNAESSALLQLATDINNALDADQFELYYQPKVNASDLSVSGGEALIRWNHPTDGMIPTDQFIAKAERLGLIYRIDEWTLRKACEQLSQWKDISRELRISVNISALQIRDGDLHERVQALLGEFEVPGHMLELEVTESVLLEDIELITHTLAEIRRLGVKVSIDDYGTGYSSLSYMKHLPADFLKIDRAFISSLHHNRADQAIVHSTITLAHDLGMKVIAEGVELREQLDILAGFNCDEIQGFLFSPAVPAQRFGEIAKIGSFRAAANDSSFPAGEEPLRGSGSGA